ncbi:hypothetical protein PV328_009628 [Microctonus aethiopoides]|uniref:WW domain-containing protein n=1 Tax=Microctonus aethiopoides TaxID=144406 RepID=A0AA39C6G7_9HYME|nr:hypothetical protein PV328_009628 [Microctonus aethiopoides]
MSDSISATCIDLPYPLQLAKDFVYWSSVIEYALRLGIDPDTEPHLLDLAREGLMAALPKGWSPCFHELSGAWYYCKQSTGTTSWEHPLDARYKELVEQARAGRSRQASIDDDSKTTAKDLESQDDATLPKEPQPLISPPTSTISKVPIMQTKIPTKLAPLRKSTIDMVTRRRDGKRPTSGVRSHSAVMTDRLSRDYTNLRFQDPKFFESPRLLDNNEQEINLSEIIKRSESMSPRYEKDWEQLSSKFNSEENIIDIDKLSVSSLTKSDTKSSTDKFSKEINSRQSTNQKELTLSGGGSIFLKSNRSRDSTPCQDGARLEDFQITVNINESGNVDRPKSILREKLMEDDDRPMEEERKSVRFDLEKDMGDIKFLYSDDGEDDEAEDWGEDSSEVKQDCANAVDKLLDSLSVNSKNCKLDEINYANKETLKDVNDCDTEIKASKETNSTPAKIVGHRFLVQNVPETDDLNQFVKEDSTTDNDYYPTNKFNNIKNIDLFSKSDSESTPRMSRLDESRSSNLDDIRKSKEIMLEAMKKTDQRQQIDKQREKDQVYQLMKLRTDLEAIDHERSKKSRRNIDEDVKNIISKQHEREIVSLKRSLEVKLEKTKREIEANFTEQQMTMERDVELRLNELKRELAEKENAEVEELINEMDEIRRENLAKMKNELEVCYEKERQEILEKLKTELNDRKRELLALRNREIEVMENDYEKTLDEEKAVKLAEREFAQQHSEKIEIMKKQMEKEFEDLKNELRTKQREKMNKVTEDHEKCLAEIQRDFRVEEGMARKVYKQQLDDLRADFSREIEKEGKKISDRATRQETVDFEKIRCEKRLLEDKYRTLKEKYLKLKNDVRLAVEKRNKRKEGNTTASETEKSASTRTRTDRTESSLQKTPSRNTSSCSRPAESHNLNATENNDGQTSLGFPLTLSQGDSRSATKIESDDTTTASETMNSNIVKKKKIYGKKTNIVPKVIQNNNNDTENPVENIRKQLEKLEDLGDQLPTNDTAYTLRYPFQDKVPVNSSSELEFFRHRIHVERDSVKRARETLKAQQNMFQGIQKAWKQRSARATLEQLVQEERELSDMEVSLHRTKSLLGEKVIHLKHLEQSLERVTSAKKNENDASPLKNDELTLSDVSSASSGFSSTDLRTDTDKLDHYQESTEIIASLENLNSEIREIWGVLNKRRGNTVPPPPTLMYSDLRWMPFQPLTTQSNNVQGFGTPNIQSNILSQLTATHPPTTTTQNIIAQYGPNSGFTTSVGTVERGPSNLIERTRNMRDWLRQARVETNDLIGSAQATL